MPITRSLYEYIQTAKRRFDEECVLGEQFRVFTELCAYLQLYYQSYAISDFDEEDIQYLMTLDQSLQQLVAIQPYDRWKAKRSLRLFVDEVKQINAFVTTIIDAKSYEAAKQLAKDFANFRSCTAKPIDYQSQLELDPPSRSKPRSTPRPTPKRPRETETTDERQEDERQDKKKQRSKREERYEVLKLIDRIQVSKSVDNSVDNPVDNPVETHVYYLVWWKGYGKQNATWESEISLQQDGIGPLIDAFESS